MEEFEAMLKNEQGAIQRFVRYKISSKEDTEDILQEVYILGYQKFEQLQNKTLFKSWMLSIARNKCNDYFRQKAKQLEIPIESLEEKELVDSRYGIAEALTVRETLALLGEKDKQILYLFFWKGIPQADIASKLHIPVGTVKSRLHTAKLNFKEKYPYPTVNLKGVFNMKRLPEILSQYKMEASTDAPFAVKWEELIGWFLVPKENEKINWAIYEMPSRKRSEGYSMKVVGKAKIHGIEGVEIAASELSETDSGKVVRNFVAQLTDTHCRYLATLQEENGMKNFVTFLDDEFLQNWGIGEDNCGNLTNLTQKRVICRDGATIKTVGNAYPLDIVGRYHITLGGKQYDTVCVMDLTSAKSGVVTEQFLDKNGRTVLWRRFNRDDWAENRYHKRWSELLPENEKLTIDGHMYVHWYDCITDYIL